MAIGANGWAITDAPGWATVFSEPGPGGGSGQQSVHIALQPVEGVPSSTQIHEAEAVIAATSVYISETVKTLYQSTRAWQRPLEWLTGGLLLSAYTSLHAAEANRVKLFSSDQLAAQLPAIRQRAARYLAADDPRSQALQGVPDPTAPAGQALVRVQSKLVQAVTAAHAVAQAKQAGPGTPVASNGKLALAGGQEHAATEISAVPSAPPGPPAEAAAETKPKSATGTESATTTDPTTGQAPSPGPAGPPAKDDALISLTGTLGLDQQIAAMALSEASRTEDQQQAQVRRFRGVLLGIVAGLLLVVGLLIYLGSVRASYFPLCLQQGAKSAPVCPTGGNKPSAWDLGFIMAIGGVGAILSVATSLSSLQSTGIRYSLSVAQGLIKIPFGAITAMLGIIILSTQANIGVLATHPGLITTAVVFGYSQQIFTQFIDKRANSLLNQAAGN